MERALKFIAGILPLLFAFAFLVPVIDQSLGAIGVTQIAGLSTLTVGLLVGGAWGAFAQLSGRWI